MTHLIVTLSLMTSPTPQKPFDSIVDAAVENCKYVKPERRNEAKRLASELYDIEKTFNVPKELKGMLLAAACVESGFNPLAKGDRKFSKSKKKPLAIGILQLWPWWERSRYKVDRKNPKSSATAWMKHIVRQIPSVKKKCRPRTEKKMWIQAWVKAIRKPKPTGRCREKPKHLRYLKKMHKALKESKQI